MKHKLTYTDNYLLVVDDSEIKEGECYLSPSGIWFYNHLNPNHVKECKKIIAHLPLNNSPILEGVPLLPPMKVKDDVENLAERSSELQEGTYTIQHKVTYKHGFIDGHNKAKEKYRFTEEDMIQAFAYGRTLEPFDSFEDFIQSLSQPKMPTYFEYIDTITTDEGTYPEWVGNYIQEP